MMKKKKKEYEMTVIRGKEDGKKVLDERKGVRQKIRNGSDRDTKERRGRKKTR